MKHVSESSNEGSQYCVTAVQHKHTQVCACLRCLSLFDEQTYCIYSPGDFCMFVWKTQVSVFFVKCSLTWVFPFRTVWADPLWGVRAQRECNVSPTHWLWNCGRTFNAAVFTVIHVCLFLHVWQTWNKLGRKTRTPPPPTFSVSSSSSPAPSLLPFSLCSYSFRAPSLRPSHLSVLSLLSAFFISRSPICPCLYHPHPHSVSPWESCPPPGSCHFICLEPCCCRCCCCLVSLLQLFYFLFWMYLTCLPPLLTPALFVCQAEMSPPSVCVTGKVIE